MYVTEPGQSSKRIRRAWTTAFLIWLCVVWVHSLMPGDASSAESSGVVFLVRPVFELFGIYDESLMTLVVRKAAHFSEYAILTFLGWNMLEAWFGKTRKARLLSLAVWLLVPCVDECIQLAVPGRAGMPTDVLIDMAGGLVGLVVSRHDAL